MKKIITILMMMLMIGLASCTTSNKTACRSKGYKVWYCGYERPQVTYRALLR